MGFQNLNEILIAYYILNESGFTEIRRFLQRISVARRFYIFFNNEEKFHSNCSVLLICITGLCEEGVT